MGGGETHFNLFENLPILTVPGMYNIPIEDHAQPAYHAARQAEHRQNLAELTSDIFYMLCVEISYQSGYILT